MDVDISIGAETLSVHIKDPYRFDASLVKENVKNLENKSGVDLSAYRLDGLIERMVRGVAGCEGGCPSDAKGLVREGFGDFSLSYVEGGILSAEQKLGSGHSLTVKIFPDFS